MKIIFLDFDGVMNKRQPFNQNQKNDIDIEAVKLLNELLSDTGANIVISSSWRMWTPMGEILRLLKEQGFNYPERIIGFTPIIPDRPRGYEIKLWLKQIDSIESFVILDDTDDMGSLFPRFVKVFDGLTPKNIQKAKELLGWKNT